MAAKTFYKVKAELIVVKVKGAQGGQVYMSRGRNLPTSVDVKERDRLVGLGLVEKVVVEEKAALAAQSAATNDGALESSKPDAKTSATESSKPDATNDGATESSKPDAKTSATESSKPVVKTSAK